MDLNKLNITNKRKSTERKKHTKILKLLYDLYVSENLNTLIEVIKSNKHILMTAPTGGGKTYAIVEVMKSFQDHINILLTPNVIQNKQNASTYGIQAFTGADKNIYSNCISATYDKARALIDYLKGKDLKVNLFIDECHLLVDATNYRMKAINDIMELSNLSDKVVYMSATNDYMKDVLTYDIELVIKPKNQLNNIMETQLMLLDEKNIDGSLVTKIIEYSQIDNRKSILFYNNIEQLKIIKRTLINQGFSDSEIVIISSEHKDSHAEKVFSDIISLSKIAEDVKVILTTSVLEVGTNIDSNNITAFVFLPRATHVNFNRIVQQVARLRVKQGVEHQNMLKICLPLRKKENNFIKSFESIKAELRERVENNINGIMQPLQNQYADQSPEVKKELIKMFLSAPLSYFNVMESYSLGVIELDEENIKPVLNEFKLQRKAKELYESQFFYNIPKLEKKLKGLIHTDAWLETIKIEDTNLKEIFEEVKEEKKKVNEEKQDFIKDTFQQIQEYELEDIFIDKIYDSDLNTGINIIEESYDKLERTNIVDLAKKGFKMHISPKEIIQSFIDHGDSVAKNRKQFLAYEYQNWNRALPLGASVTLNKTVTKEYVYCRNIFDTICIKQGRLSQSKKREFLIKLIESKIVKGYEIKEGNIYHKLSKKQIESEKKKEKDKEFSVNEKGVVCMVPRKTKTNTPITKEKIDKIVLPLINTIYNVSNDKLSSLLI